MIDLLELTGGRRPTPRAMVRIYAWALRSTFDLARCGIRQAWIALALELALGILILAIVFTIWAALIFWIFA